MEKESYKKLKEQYVLRHAAGEYFLLNLKQSDLKVKMPTVINETGADIWKFYIETGNVEDTVKRFCAEYEIDEDTANEAVTDFFDDLERQANL